mmetsp:Transcript_23474/g.41614  ORF Transcript_23474/g.41614 Transcript_23474/m.41614 type:complete len:498 (+) Transcript_23474:2191-3684(+)
MLALLIVVGALAKSLLHTEISATHKLIEALQIKQTELTRLKTELTESQLEQLSEENWQAYLEEERRKSIDNEFLKSMSFRYKLDLSAPAVSLDFITLRVTNSHSVINPQNAGLVLCFADKIEVYDISGRLLASAEGLSGIRLCAVTSTPDDVRMAAASDTALHVYELELEVTTREGKSISREEKYSLSLIHTEPLEKPPSCIQGYSKLNKKYWVLGYLDSSIDLRNFNGTEPRAADADVPIYAMDRVAQQVAYAGHKTVGIYSVTTMEPYILCEKTTSDVVDISIDYYSTQLFSVLANGDILIFDTKHPTSQSHNTCKAVARFSNNYAASGAKLAAVKGGFVSWSRGGVLSYYNTSFFDIDDQQPPLHLTIPDAKGQTVPLVDSFRLYSGSLIALAAKNATQVHVFEVTTTMIRVESNDNFPLSFGAVRFIAIAIGIGVVMYWKVFKKGPTAEQRSIEKFEKEFGPLRNHKFEQSKKLVGDRRTKLSENPPERDDFD